MANIGRAPSVIIERVLRELERVVLLLRFYRPSQADAVAAFAS
jgi:hypothetical protein